MLTAMTQAEWRQFLQDLSRVALADDLQREPQNRMFSPEVHAAGYIGREGATEAEIAAAELRLGAQLPPSYRTFLLVSNGLPEMSSSVMPGDLYSADKIYWLREHDPHNLKAWGEIVEPDEDISPEEHIHWRDERGDGGMYREAYVANLLSISDRGDACDLLLSPEVVDINGEWECWKIANWHPGAHRFRTFEMWIQQEYQFLAEPD